MICNREEKMRRKFLAAVGFMQQNLWPGQQGTFLLMSHHDDAVRPRLVYQTIIRCTLSFQIMIHCMNYLDICFEITPTEGTVVKPNIRVSLMKQD